MTEAEWLVCNDAEPMFDYLLGRSADRKLRLLAIARGRWKWGSLEDECLQDAVLLGERYVEGLVTDEEMRIVGDQLVREARELGPIKHRVRTRCLCCVGMTKDEIVDCGFVPKDGGFMVAQVEFLRDIFGNPFRPVTFSPSWGTSTTVALASQMYDSRDFSAMPILADALQDAGCDSVDVLDHCRGSGPHVRGCWVVDLVLGKE